VAQGADVGDGSLIYANISCEAPPHVFEVSTLKPYYDAVAKFMNVQKIPDNQWTDRMKLMQKGEGRFSTTSIWRRGSESAAEALPFRA
jgi:cholesterol oxidase